MARRRVLIVARADVSPSFREALQAAHGGRHGHISAVEYRRTTDAAGSATYHVAHGTLSARVWASVLDALNGATQGVRDSVKWQGKDSGVAVAEATWAAAMAGGDIIGGFYMTDEEDPTAILARLGFVETATDGPKPQGFA